MRIRVCPSLWRKWFLLHGLTESVLIDHEVRAAVLQDKGNPFRPHHILHADPGGTDHHGRKPAGNESDPSGNPDSHKLFAADPLLKKPGCKSC